MKKLCKKQKIVFIFALFLSIGFVASIPAIIFGAINGITLLLVVGIIFAVLGFYGSPILWIQFGALNKTKRIVYAVDEEKIYTVEEISKQLQLSISEVKAQLITAINKNYIEGLLFDGEKLTANKNKSTLKNLSRCENCGAPLKKTPDGKYCPYCHSMFEK
jgi:Zn finger protein HypA/HybF involved in hydrogenase expression